MKKKIKILVTGSNGYIGTKLCEYLVKQKYDVMGLDSNFFSKCQFYKIKYRYKYKSMDIRDVADDFLKKFDILIHLAGISNNPVENFKNKNKIYEITRAYTKKIALKCKKNNIKFIFASSCSVYGESNKQNLKEESLCNPISHYSKNKLDIEYDLKKISNNKFNPIILRISTVFGFSPKMRLDLALTMFLVMARTQGIIKLNSDGQSWRPHLYLDDLIKVFELCINYSNKKTMVINVGSNENNYKLIDVAKIIANLTNSKIEFLNKKNTNTLIKDKTVNYGKDRRSYIVNFDKFNKIFPDFKFTPLLTGLKKDLKFCDNLNFSNKILNNKKYFRLHYLEHLITTKKISKNLRLIKIAKS